MLATRSRHRRLLVSGLATAVVMAVPFAAGAASSDDQARADAGIAAFGAAATGAGYTDSGEANDDADPLDLSTDADSETVDSATIDSSGGPTGAEACLPDLSSVVDADGTLIGESARSSSNTFDFTDPTATVSTDPFAFTDSASIYAVVFVVDEAHQDGLGTLIDVFGSPEVSSCLTAAVQTPDSVTGDTTFAPGGFVITNESDLGVGDQSASLTSTIQFELNGVSTGFSSEVAVARVDRALAITFADWSTGSEPDFTAEDALAAVVDAL